MRWTWLRCLCALALAALLPASGAPSTEVIYPGDDFRYAEYIELLHTALEKTVATDGPFTLHPARLPMTEPRFLLEARKGRLVNVVWSASDRDKEAQLIPIRIPLSKGLLGWRVMLIEHRMQGRLEHVSTLEDLKDFSFGLGLGWGDVPIYRSAGLNVMTAEYDDLFAMLSRGRFDLFSRGVNEAYDELRVLGGRYPDIVVERHLALHYRYPFYFFVSPAQPALARRIERGLRIMLEDGSYDAIFLRHNRDHLEKARLCERRVIEIDNPHLPPLTPVGDARLWYQPKDQAKAERGC